MQVVRYDDKLQSQSNVE